MNDLLAWASAVSPAVVAGIGWWTIRQVNSKIAAKTSAEERQINTMTNGQLREQVESLWVKRSECQEKLLKAEQRADTLAEELVRANALLANHEARICRLADQVRDLGATPANGS